MRKNRLLFAKLCCASLVLLLSACGEKPRNTPAINLRPVEIPADEAAYLSGRNTMVYHHHTCAYCRDIPDKEQIGYLDPAAAASTGRIPCAICKPNQRESQQSER